MSSTSKHFASLQATADSRLGTLGFADRGGCVRLLAPYTACMDFKQSNMGEILDSEHQMVLAGAERFGAYFVNASDFNALLARFVKSVRPDRYIFAMFLSQIRKHTTLALFSAVRLHRIQAQMDLRQVLEAGSCAAYALVNPDPSGFVDVDTDGILDASKELTTKRYRWLDEHFSLGSVAIKKMKKTINESTAHSNIVYAHNTFKFDDEQGRFRTPFFDLEDEYLVQTDLWQVANVAMGLMDLLYGVDQTVHAVQFVEDFVPALKVLEAENNRLKAEMMATERYRRVQEGPAGG